MLRWTTLFWRGSGCGSGFVEVRADGLALVVSALRRSTERRKGCPPVDGSSIRATSTVSGKGMSKEPRPIRAAARTRMYPQARGNRLHRKRRD